MVIDVVCTVMSIISYSIFGTFCSFQCWMWCPCKMILCAMKICTCAYSSLFFWMSASITKLQLTLKHWKKVLSNLVIILSFTNLVHIIIHKKTSWLPAHPRKISVQEVFVILGDFLMCSCSNMRLDLFCRFQTILR